METAVEVIVLSDDDEGPSGLDASVVVVEKRELGETCPAASLDQDLLVTSCRPAPVLAHARFDCPVHPFRATDADVSAPAADNHRTCEQCFCYVCDKPASTCPAWSSRGGCHCNSHKRSEFWLRVRGRTLLGRLQDFGLTLSQVDRHLREAGSSLQAFRDQLAVEFSSYLRGSAAPDPQNRPQVVYDYTRVYQCVSRFLNRADAQESRAAAVMRLGAAQDFLTHFQNHSSSVPLGPVADVSPAKVLLLTRVASAVQRQMVMGELSSEFSLKLQDFYSKLPFSADVRTLRSRLAVRLWDDVLLVTVLKGQNVLGVRQYRGRKDVLLEDVSVVLLRLEFLLRERRFRELQRYLRVVQSNDGELFRRLQDLLPYVMCLDGDFSSALGSLFMKVSSPMSRLGPDLFLMYFRIFREALAPRLLLHPPGHVGFALDPWEPVLGAAPLNKPVLVKFALRVLGCRPTVSASSQCWTHLLRFVALPSPPAPPLDFLQEVDGTVSALLREHPDLHLPLPQHFHAVFPDQFLLLLVTGALGLRLLQEPLRPLLPVLLPYRDCQWAYVWLLGRLSSSPGRLASFLPEVMAELEPGSDAGDLFLTSVLSLLFSHALAGQVRDP